MAEVRVKICGMTRMADVQAAISSGADYLGFVFARSPRQLTAERAVELIEGLPGRVRSVGLFMDQDAAYVNAVLQQVSLDMLQFHGTEDAGHCAQYGLPYIKAIAMGGATPDHTRSGEYRDAAGLLYDGHEPGNAGGTGKAFDWSLIVPGGQPFWLAGGLDPDNVASAIRRCRPWAVDVSSGVEDRPGVKNHELMDLFIRRAKSVDLHNGRT